MNKNKLESAIIKYETEISKAYDKLINTIRPDVEQICLKWGWEFYSGMGGWNIKIRQKTFKEKYNNYYLMSDSRWLLDYFEKDLADILEKELVDRNTIGSCIGNISIPIEKYKWVWIKGTEDYAETYTTLTLISIDSELKENNVYFGPISIQLAESIIETYNSDIDTGSVLLRCIEN